MLSMMYELRLGTAECFRKLKEFGQLRKVESRAWASSTEWCRRPLAPVEQISRSLRGYSEIYAR